MNCKQGVSKSFFCASHITCVLSLLCLFFNCCIYDKQTFFYFYFYGITNYLSKGSIYIHVYLAYEKSKTRQDLDKYKNLPILQHLASFFRTILSGRGIYY